MITQQQSAPIEFSQALSSQTAPSFIIGRDAEGHWLAVETHGLAGGLFTSPEAAWRYASFETDRREGAVRLVSEPVALRM